MANNHIPKFAKVSLRVKLKGAEDLDIYTRTFENCGLMITGDYLIITIDDGEGTNGKVFNLKDVLEYKTYNQ